MNGLRNALRPYLPHWLRRLRHSVYVVKNATYNADGMMTVHDSDFMGDARFQQAYDSGRKTGSWGLSDIPWRAYTACWAAQHAMQLEGDFVECGVNRGGLARTVIEYTGFARHPQRKFYLLDTFCGFPQAMKHQAAAANLGDYRDCYEDVVQTFRDVPNAILIKGMIPDTLAEVPAAKIAYLSIDLNVAEPEVAAVEYFWDKLVAGAIILLDDYGFGPAYHRQKLAMNALMKEKQTEVLLLPTGQGMIVKP